MSTSDIDNQATSSTALTTIALGKAKSLAEYIEIVLTTRATWQPNQMWFRGHRRFDYNLKPTAYRLDTYLEESAFNVFWARGRGLPGLRDLDANHDWDWYFAARHHGLPTRLLDWTINGLVALFFATEPLQSPQEVVDARVWLLDPIWMNDIFLQDPYLRIPFSLIADDFMNWWLPSRVKAGNPTKFEDDGDNCTNQRPVAIYPSHTNDRLIAQQGMFTVHGADTSPLEEQLVSVSSNCNRLGYITIDGCCVDQIHGQLALLGVTRFSLMPDPDNLAEHMKRFYTK